MAAAVDKEQLQAEIGVLADRLKKGKDEYEKQATSEGRPVDVRAFFAGESLSKKYPGGPICLAYPYRPTVLTLLAGVSFQDWAATAVGCGIFYGLGFKHAPTLGMARLSGNRLGAILTIPVIVVGVTSGMKKAMSRHLGFLENGMPRFAEFKDYKVDSSVPYFVRHEVSDRRRMA